MLFAIAYKYTRDTFSSEDAVQDTFLKLYRTNKEFESDEHMKNWLVRVIINESINVLKRNKKIQIKMTRTDDTFIPLGTRAKIANDFKADIFVSIHANAAPNKKAKGFEVYFRSDKASDKEAAHTAALENEALNYEEKGVGNVTYADLLLNSLATNENINESSKLAARIRNIVS